MSWSQFVTTLFLKSHDRTPPKSFPDSKASCPLKSKPNFDDYKHIDSHFLFLHLSILFCQNVLMGKWMIILLSSVLFTSSAQRFLLAFLFSSFLLLLVALSSRSQECTVLVQFLLVNIFSKASYGKFDFQ